MKNRMHVLIFLSVMLLIYPLKLTGIDNSDVVQVTDTNMIFIGKGSYIRIFKREGKFFRKEFSVDDFYLSRYEVTFDEYDQFCKVTEREMANHAGWARGRRPVIYISWWNAVSYCEWINSLYGYPASYNSRGDLIESDGSITTDVSKVPGFRLPMENEWEFAARGGEKGEKGFFEEGNRLSNNAHLIYMNKRMTYPVGYKNDTNSLGLFDMDSNVWEWCSDLKDVFLTEPENSGDKGTDNPYGWQTNSYYWRVVRGGNYHFTPWNYAVKGMDYPESSFCIGFRLARSKINKK